MASSGPWATGWGDDPWTWNVQGEGDEDDEDGSRGDGMPGRALVHSAVSFWSRSCPEATVEDVARVFNIPLHMADDVEPCAGVPPSDLSTALQVWSLLVGGDVSVDLAAVVLAVPVRSVLAALDDHPWMYAESRGGVLCVGHEGE